jgi:hypothetical protein
MLLAERQPPERQPPERQPPERQPPERQPPERQPPERVHAPSSGQQRAHSGRPSVLSGQQLHQHLSMQALRLSVFLPQQLLFEVLRWLFVLLEQVWRSVSWTSLLPF